VLLVTNKLTIGLKDLRGATRFSFEGIPGNVRRADIGFLQQRHIEIRLSFPDIQHNAQRLTGIQPVQQCCIVDDRPTAGIDQNSARLQSANQRIIRHVQRFVGSVFKQWRMESQHIGLLYQFVQRAEIALVTAIGSRWIAQQRADPQRFQTRLQTPTHVAHTHNAYGAIA